MRWHNIYLASTGVCTITTILFACLFGGYYSAWYNLSHSPQSPVAGTDIILDIGSDALPNGQGSVGSSGLKLPKCSSILETQQIAKSFACTIDITSPEAITYSDFTTTTNFMKLAVEKISLTYPGGTGTSEYADLNLLKCCCNARNWQNSMCFLNPSSYPSSCLDSSDTTSTSACMTPTEWNNNLRATHMTINGRTLKCLESESIPKVGDGWWGYSVPNNNDAKTQTIIMMCGGVFNWNVG